MGAEMDNVPHTTETRLKEVRDEKKFDVTLEGISVASRLQILMDHLLQLLGPYGGTCVVYIYLGCAWLVLSKT